MSFPIYRQIKNGDCGQICLFMIAKFYGTKYTQLEIEDFFSFINGGVSLYCISEIAKKIGFNTLGVFINFKNLSEEVPLPCIIHWKQRHFVVVYKIKNNKVFIADPAKGLITYSRQEFLNNWINSITDNKDEGIALLLVPIPKSLKFKIKIK